LQKKDVITGLSKKSSKNLQINDTETERLIENFILSFDLLSNVEYDREAECYRAKSAFDPRPSQDYKEINFQSDASLNRITEHSGQPNGQSHDG